MLNKLLSMLRSYDMLQSGDTVICAVSGGADSVAMLFAFWLLKDKLGIRLEAAHFNHHLRGAESDRDEAFVRQLCDRYDIMLHLGGGTVTAGKKGLEAAAREARYAFFETLEGKIATAHTADDNAETVLMHMVRGTGLKGLGAISPVRGKLIRPMLLTTREQVLAFLEEYHLSWVQDSSNDTDAFLRNRLRRYVMPLLRQENPRISENLSAMALRLREDEAALCQQQDMTRGLDVARLRDMPPSGRSRMLDSFLKHCGVTEPDAAHIALAESLVFSEKPSARASFPGGITLRRRYDRLVVGETLSPLQAAVLACPGMTDIPELNLRVHCFRAEHIVNTEDTFCVNAGSKLVLRCRQPGDTIRLAGGTRSVKKLFVDRKIPADSRARIPILADELGILGILGIGADRDRMADSLPAVMIRFEILDPMNK